jgi:hypothetical protein
MDNGPSYDAFPMAAMDPGFLSIVAIALDLAH